jgi:hypothetical protein
MNNIWYLEHPTFRYEQGVKGLAIEAGLVIVDPANAPEDRPGAADVVPVVTLRPEFRPPVAETAPAPADEPPAAPEPEPEAAPAKPKAPKKAAATKSTDKE